MRGTRELGSYLFFSSVCQKNTGTIRENEGKVSGSWKSFNERLNLCQAQIIRGPYIVCQIVRLPPLQLFFELEAADRPFLVSSTFRCVLEVSLSSSLRKQDLICIYSRVLRRAYHARCFNEEEHEKSTSSDGR